MKLWDDSFLSLKLYLACFIIAAGYAVISTFIRNRISDRWSFAQGTVERSSVRVEHGDRTVFVAEIAYSFSLNGEFYGGQHKHAFTSEEAADAFVRTFAAGAPVTIRCRAGHPVESMLREDDNHAALAVTSSR
jgi:Protein of unknown function (DUF3592)